jgi:hypothetical protein
MDCLVIVKIYQVRPKEKHIIIAQWHLVNIIELFHNRHRLTFDGVRQSGLSDDLFLNGFH